MFGFVLNLDNSLQLELSANRTNVESFFIYWNFLAKYKTNDVISLKKKWMPYAVRATNMLPYVLYKSVSIVYLLVKLSTLTMIMITTVPYVSLYNNMLMVLEWLKAERAYNTATELQHWIACCHLLVVSNKLPTHLIVNMWNIIANATKRQSSTQ